MVKKERPQEKYDKNNMDRVVGKYKKDFVTDFKEACNILGVSQSEIIREAMIRTIERKKQLEKEIKKMITIKNESGYTIEINVGDTYRFSELYNDEEGCDVNDLLSSECVAIYFVNNENEREEVLIDFEIFEFNKNNPLETIVKVIRIS